MKTNFTPVAEDTRINVKIKAQSETEINGRGPKISEAEVAAFKAQFDKLTADDVVIFAGSLAPNLDDNFYFDLIELIRSKGAQFVIDTTGESLLKTLAQKPLVVKPNNHELADLFDVEFTGMDDIVKYGRKLLDLGAQHVLISMAGDGGLMITKDKVYRSYAPKGTVINSVGAGDSLVAGFLAAYLETEDTVYAFCYGVACGSASAFSSSFVTREEADELVQSIIPCRIR